MVRNGTQPVYRSFIWITEKTYITSLQGVATFLQFFSCVEESLQVHQCQSYQQPEGQIKQTTGECRVRSTSYDKGSLERTLRFRSAAAEPIASRVLSLPSILIGTAPLGTTCVSLP